MDHNNKKELNGAYHNLKKELHQEKKDFAHERKAEIRNTIKLVHALNKDLKGHDKDYWKEHRKEIHHDEYESIDADINILHEEMKEYQELKKELKEEKKTEEKS